MADYYQVCAIPKGEPRKRTKARKDRQHRDHVTDTRIYVFGRERDVCRCCRFRSAQSMDELTARGAGGRVSKRNSIAVCGEIVGAVPSCHTYLQLNQIACDQTELGAEGPLVFRPLTREAADWLHVKVGESILSEPMRVVEAEY